MTSTKAAAIKNTRPDYDSNPFTLAFNSFARFFNTNMVWAVVFLVFAILGAMGQFVGNLAELATPSKSSQHSQTHRSTGEIISMPNPDPATADNDSISTGAIVLIVAVVSVVLLIIVGGAVAVSTLVGGMFAYVAIESEQHKTVEFSEAWHAAIKRFWRLFGAQLLAGLKICAWTLLFIVPGIIAALRYTLLPYVVMATAEDEKGIKNTHDKTKSLVKGRLLEVFGIATVAAIIPIVGPLLKLTGNAALYTQLQAYEGKEKPKVHWLNYLGFILLGLLLVFLLCIGLIVTAIVLSHK